MNKNELLRRIPKVDEVLAQPLVFDCFAKSGREAVTEAVREVIDGLRARILTVDEAGAAGFNPADLGLGAVAAAVTARLAEKERNRLYGVINATGTILHTNLGRAPLCREAVENVAAVSRGYSNLEYDVKAGQRGSRHDIIRDLVVELTGAEDAMVVNNNASATMLVLSSIAAGREVVVSRGELVEIGGAFRIPDIMAQSGAFLREVGTTNKTKPSDYENAILTREQAEAGDYPPEPDGAARFATGALMKVHTSNYKIMGFTEEATLENLVEIGRKHKLPVIFDMGNGLMVDLSAYGLDEPNVPASLATGIDVMLFSGDKLLGGPQAGIIVGRRKYIEKMKKHPLARALRVDKMTFAALEETLKKYRDAEVAKRDIPVLRMITESAETLRARAGRLAEAICGDAWTGEPGAAVTTPDGLTVRVVEVEDQIGGGSAPMVYLPGFAVAVTAGARSTQSLERALRKATVPVIARIRDDQLLLCVRTIADEEVGIVAEAVKGL